MPEPFPSLIDHREQAKPGDVIANGATVVAVTTLSHVDLLFAILLCIWNGEYVTWTGDYDGQRTSLGHYHGQDFAAALEDYAARVDEDYKGRVGFEIRRP